MKKLLPAVLVAALVFGPFAILALLAGLDLQEGGPQERCASAAGPAGGGRVWMPLAKDTYTTTSGYGMRVNPVTGHYRLHAGTDYGAPEGTRIYAIWPGTVTHAGPAGGYGNLLLIDHHIEGRPVQSAYAHIRSGGINVDEGDQVAGGQIIAEVGTTGNSTGSHLHFEIRVKASSSRWASTDSAIWLKDHDAAHPDPNGTECDRVGTVPSVGPGGVPGAPAPYTGPDGMVTDPSGTGGKLTGPTAHLWHQVRAAFPASTGFCFAHRADGGEHPKGRACDITPGNKFGAHPTKAERERGWAMATWIRKHARVLRIQYVIYQGKIWSQRYADQGWRTYYWRGSQPTNVTLGHYDHLHVSVRN